MKLIALCGTLMIIIKVPQRASFIGSIVYFFREEEQQKLGELLQLLFLNKLDNLSARQYFDTHYAHLLDVIRIAPPSLQYNLLKTIFYRRDHSCWTT